MPFSYSVSNQVIAADVAALLVDVAALNAQNVLILADTGDLLTDHVALLTATQLNQREADAIIRYNANQVDLDAILADLYQFTPYSYGPTELANNTTYVPADRTIVTMALLEGGVVAADDFFFYVRGAGNQADLDAFLQLQAQGARAMNGVMYCDGVVGFQNRTGAAQDLTLWGVTMA